MNELKDIIDKLYDEYGNGLHWEVIEARKADGGNWVLIVKKPTEKNGGKK